MSHGPDKLSTYIAIFVALLVLTALTVWVAFFHLGWLNIPVALGIAILKAMLVILFFMHVRHSDSMTKFFIGSGVACLLILFGFSYADVLTREWPKTQAEDSWVKKSPEHYNYIPKEIYLNKSDTDSDSDHSDHH